MKKRDEELEKLAADPDFWNNPEKAKEVSKERASLATVLEPFAQAQSALEDATVLHEMAADADAEEEIEEIEKLVAKTEGIVDKLEFARMLGGEHDNSSAIVEINSGAGGTESCDWANMLLRMYLRYCERSGFDTELIHVQAGEEAGIKSATFTADGAYAFGYLKAERGVHRLVRISPFDSNKRRHTSFASVMVTPEIDDAIEIEIDEDDLRVDTYRSSGAGGQHVNKTDSAVRLTHIPTGLVVACQNERSQHKNRATAMKILRARLYELEMRKRDEEAAAMAGEKKKIEWGSQIRSYILHPYQMVKDHRTGVETSNTSAVLDGDLDSFIEAALAQNASGK